MSKKLTVFNPTQGVLLVPLHTLCGYPLRYGGMGGGKLMLEAYCTLCAAASSQLGLKHNLFSAR